MKDYQTIDKEILAQKLKILMILRVAVATTLLGSQILFHINDESKSFAPLFLIVSTYLLSIVYALFISKVNDIVAFTYLQLIGDLTLETGIIYATGGANSPFTFLYFLTIITSGLMLFEHSCFVIAGFSSFFYTGILVFNSFLETAKRGFTLRDMHLLLFPKFYDLSLNIFSFFFVAFLASHFAGTILITGKKLKETHDDLSELQSFTENILQSMHSGLVTIDLDGNISYVNTAVEKISGFKESELIGKSWNYLFKSQPVDDILKNNFQSSSLFGQIECHLLQKESKNQIPVGMSISPLLNESKDVSGLIIIFKDLTDIRRLQEEMRRSDKLAALGRLSAGLAHEIRNPLASMSGSVQLLREESKLKHENVELMEIIVTECDRLNKILSDFLMFAKPRSLNLIEYDMVTVISEVIQLIKNQVHKDKIIDFKFHADPAEILIQVDIDMIKQVLWNLLRNAIQSTHSGGKVFIMVIDRNSSDFSGEDSIIEMEGEFQNILDESIEEKYIEIFIKDTGCGIEKTQFKKIFDPFYTTRDGGSGLGLAIVHKIIESHRGKIYVESTIDKGSTFNILLPLNQDAERNIEDMELQEIDSKVEVI